MASSRQKRFMKDRRRRRERQLAESSKSFTTRVLRGSRRMFRRSFSWKYNKYPLRKRDKASIFTIIVIFVIAFFYLINLAFIRNKIISLILNLLSILTLFIVLTWDYGKKSL